MNAISALKVSYPQITIVAVEQDAKSIPYDKAAYTLPLAIVVGNETTGVSREVLDIADYIVELPMWGINKSLNVMVSCGIILYEIMKQYSESKK
jgi:tRNA G18 (ribose-2'-O)-methylase SpoU